MLPIIDAMRTTPTAAIEIMFSLPPLHILMKREAVHLTMVGLPGDILGELRKSLETLDILLTDALISEYNFEKNFQKTLLSGLAK